MCTCSRRADVLGSRRADVLAYEYSKGGRAMASLVRLRWLLVLVLARLPLCCGPTGTSFTLRPSPNLHRGAAQPSPSLAYGSAHGEADGALPGGLGGGAAALAAAAVACTCRSHRATQKRSFSSREPCHFPWIAAAGRPATSDEDDAALDEPSADSDSDVEYDAFEVDQDEFEDMLEQPAADLRSVSRSSGAGKLWSRKEFPEGTKGHKNWDISNLLAAQSWTCPCRDRKNCIGTDRLHSVLELYDHRKAFRTTAHLRGGYRDACREDMQQRFDASSNTFTRSFKVFSVHSKC